MNYKKWLGIAAGSVLLMLSMTTHAQKMYRCGSTYQDRPCDSVQPGKEVRNFDNAPKPVVAASTDAQCRQRGIDSQKIVWSREAGALAEKQMAGASPEEKSLIAEVYTKRGSAPEVRAAIEADCIAAKKQAEQAAAMIAAGLKLQGKDSVVSPAPVRTAVTEGKTAEASQADNTADRRVAENKKALCASINARIEDIQKNLRIGGSIASMESMNLRRREAEAERSRAGC